MNDVFWSLILGLVCILGIASLVGFLLQQRAQGLSPTINNLNARIKTWWVIVGVLSLAIGLGPRVTVLLFGLASFMALREFISLTPTRASDHWTLVLSFFIIVPLQYIFLAMKWYGMFSIFIPVYVFFALSAVSALGQDTEDFLARNAKVQSAIMVTVYGASYAPALLTLDIPGYEGQTALLLFFFLFVVQISDVLQYVCGKLFGRTKVSPVVSPSKTVEGLVGGGLLAALCGTALHSITPFSGIQAFFLSLVIVAAGFLGGLVLSAVKRSLGAKDWGTVVTGHGGALDRLDSVCFAAPIFFHLTRYFFCP
jgi:phosphatidate cytidylyltransferase